MGWRRREHSMGVIRAEDDLLRRTSRESLYKTPTETGDTDNRARRVLFAVDDAVGVGEDAYRNSALVQQGADLCI